MIRAVLTNDVAIKFFRKLTATLLVRLDDSGTYFSLLEMIEQIISHSAAAYDQDVLDRMLVGADCLEEVDHFLAVCGQTHVIALRKNKIALGNIGLPFTQNTAYDVSDIELCMQLGKGHAAKR